MRSIRQDESKTITGFSEARRLVSLANQRLRVLDSDAAFELLQAALDALPRRAQKLRGAKRPSTNT